MTMPNDPDGERPGGPESFSSSEESPPTQSDSSLVPPPGKPPTAVGAGPDPEFPLRPRQFGESWRQPGWGHRTPFAHFVTEIFNTLDAVADRIAETLRLRH